MNCGKQCGKASQLSVSDGSSGIVSAENAEIINRLYLSKQTNENVSSLASYTDKIVEWIDYLDEENKELIHQKIDGLNKLNVDDVNFFLELSSMTKTGSLLDIDYSVLLSKDGVLSVQQAISKEKSPTIRIIKASNFLNIMKNIVDDSKTDITNIDLDAVNEISNIVRQMIHELSNPEIDNSLKDVDTVELNDIFENLRTYIRMTDEEHEQALHHYILNNKQPRIVFGAISLSEVGKTHGISETMHDELKEKFLNTLAESFDEMAPRLGDATSKKASFDGVMFNIKCQSLMQVLNREQRLRLVKTFFESKKKHDIDAINEENGLRLNAASNEYVDERVALLAILSKSDMKEVKSYLPKKIRERMRYSINSYSAEMATEKVNTYPALKRFVDASPSFYRGKVITSEQANRLSNAEQLMKVMQEMETPLQKASMRKFFYHSFTEKEMNAILGK